MFLKRIHDKNQQWEFQLLNNVRVTGKVVDHTMDGNGHPLMIQVRTMYETWDIPWTSIIRITIPTQGDGNVRKPNGANRTR